MRRFLARRGWIAALCLSGASGAVAVGLVLTAGSSSLPVITPGSNLVLSNRSPAEGVLFNASAGPNAAPVATPPSVSGNPAAETVEENAQASLATKFRSLTTGHHPSPSATYVHEAVGDLGAALNPRLWSETNLDGNHVGPTTGALVFQNTEAAVRALLHIDPPAWVVALEIDLADAARQLAATAITDNSCSARTPSRLAAAEAALAAGDTAFAHGNYLLATVDYALAWADALAARGTICATPGLSVGPTGAPAFSVTHMIPLDSDPSPTITVTVSGTSATEVALYEENLTGTFLPALNLKIVEDGLHTIYNGALQSGWTSGSPLVLPGSVGNTWAIGEHHSFVFTVSFPSPNGANGHLDNTFQGTTGSLNFVWARS